MSGPLTVAVGVEARKAVASRVLVACTVLLVAGVAAISAATTSAAASGNAQIAAKLGPVAAQGGWPGLLAAAHQVTAAAAFGAFGIGLSWTFGREFAEGTITGLFALPVSRARIALAKLAVHIAWTTVTAVLLTATVAVTATMVTGSPPDAAARGGLLRLLALAVMTGVLPFPAAWAATAGRGLLPGIATIAVLMVAAQILVLAGDGAGWFPLSAPALWAIRPGAVTALQLASAGAVAAAFAALTLLAWRRLRLHR